MHSAPVSSFSAAVAVDACRYFGALILGALARIAKDDLLSTRFDPAPNYWLTHPLDATIADIASGSFKRKSPPEIRGTGYAAHSLEAALWAFHGTRSFEEGCLAAVNLGDDADTTAAVFGQLAGAFYGEEAIPLGWRRQLAKRELIEGFADKLLTDAVGEPLIGEEP